MEDGKLNDFATEIVEELKTYAELSISGTGVHLLARAPRLFYDRERYYINNRKYGLEIYPAGVTTKFIVTTGNAINDFDINECTDAKLFLIKLQQEDGKSYSSIHTIRGVLRPAFQMAVDDDILVKNPFGFQLAGVLVNDSVTREAITKVQMRKILKFVHDDVVYCKYYEVVYILLHTGMRISEFCGLTLKDIDLEKRIVNIDHQLQRTSDMRYIIETTKTDAGTRKLPITEDVAQMFQAIIEDRKSPKVEKAIDGYSGFLFYDENDMHLVAMHCHHRFNHMVGRYNDIYRVQMPNITPHVCRHTYCSNMAKLGMNPKTLQYLMGHSDISVTMNVYTYIGFDDAKEELKRMEEFRKAQAEIEKKNEKPMSQKMFKVV